MSAGWKDIFPPSTPKQPRLSCCVQLRTASGNELEIELLPRSPVGSRRAGQRTAQTLAPASSLAETLTSWLQRSQVLTSLSAETKSWFLGPGGGAAGAQGPPLPRCLVTAPTGQAELSQWPALSARLTLDLERGQEAGWVTESTRPCHLHLTGRVPLCLCSPIPECPQPSQGTPLHILPNYYFVQLFTAEGEKRLGERKRAETSIMKF